MTTGAKIGNEMTRGYDNSDNEGGDNDCDDEMTLGARGHLSRGYIEDSL